MASPNGRSKTPSTPRIAQLWRQSPQTWKVRPPNKKIPIPKALSHSPLGSLHGWVDGTATTESPVPLSCSMGSLASKLSSMDGLYEMCESRRVEPAGYDRGWVSVEPIRTGIALAQRRIDCARRTACTFATGCTPGAYAAGWAERSAAHRPRLRDRQ